MKIPINTLLTCLLLLLQSPAYAETPMQSALSMIQEFGLGQNLTTMSQQVAVSTTTYAVIVKNIGVERAKTLVNKELRLTLPPYQEKWDHNLAESYLEQFSQEELQSIEKEKWESPYFNKFQSMQSVIGESMKAKSNPMFKHFISTALKKSFEKSVRNEQINQPFR